MSMFDVISDSFVWESVFISVIKTNWYKIRILKAVLLFSNLLEVTSTIVYLKNNHKITVLALLSKIKLELDGSNKKKRTLSS